MQHEWKIMINSNIDVRHYLMVRLQYVTPVYSKNFNNNKWIRENCYLEKQFLRERFYKWLSITTLKLNEI